MIRFRFTDGTLNVLISKEERIDLNSAKNLIKKGRRIIRQNKANSLRLELKNRNKINSCAMNLFVRAARCSSDFPINIISN